MKSKFGIADDDGVAGIVAALITHDKIKIRGKVIGDLSFAFVPPLRSNDRYDLFSCVGHNLIHHGDIVRAALSGAGVGNTDKFHIILQLSD